MEYAMADAVIVKVHRHGQGAKGFKTKPIGHSRRGVRARIRALCDALGNLFKFVLISLKTSLASSRSSNALPCAVNLISARADSGL